MHCLRRAALRTAIAASRPAASRTSASLIAQSSFRATPVTTKAFGQAARCFSQTARFGNAENEIKAEQEQPEQQLEDATQEKPRQKPTQNQKFPDESGVFIRNMIFDATEKHLESAFEKYGEVLHVSIARDARGLSKGYGFVYFKDPASVAKAVEEVDGSFWHGRRVHCAPRTPSTTTAADKRKAAKSHSDEPTDTLYIGNIPYETTDAELNQLFRDLEGVEDIRVAVDRTTGWPRGFCHAQFSNIETAKKGYTALEGYKLGDRILTIDYSGSRKDNNKKQWTDSKN